MGLPASPNRGLDRVTLCAVTSRDVALTEVALLRSSEELSFARVVLFSPVPPSSDLIEHVPIVEFEQVEDYSRFVLFELGKHIQTDFARIIHIDGFVLNPGAWEEGFLDYDYIGARWPWHAENQVGNGGFCLRSKGLLNATASPRFDRPEIPEDQLICREERKYLESELGFRFAPHDVADRFALEHAAKPEQSLGFHGLLHLHLAYDEDEMQDVLSLMNPATLTGITAIVWFLTLLDPGTHSCLPRLAQAILTAQPREVLAKNCTKLGHSPEEVAQALFWVAGKLESQ